MKANLKKTIAALSLSMAVQAAFAGNITDINVSVLADQQRVIKVKFDRDVVEPSGFITGSPARIVLDFPGTDVQLSQNTLSFNDTLLNQVVAAHSNGRTRVLLGLTKEGEYNTEVKGNEVWVYVSEASKAPSTSSARSSNTMASYSAPTDMPFTLDFHKGGAGSGVITYGFDQKADAQVQVRNDRLIVLLKDYPISTQDQKNLDVTDFSTPVRNIVAKRMGKDTQIMITMQGGWSHKVNKKNGAQEIVVMRSSNVASRAVQNKQQKFTGKNISLDFQNVDVRTILQILAKESGKNIVASDSVQGKMTLVLKDVPWDQALALVMDARDLDMRENGNVINIAPRKELADKEKDKLNIQVELDNLGRLETRNFQLKYKKVEEFRDVLKLTDGGSSNSNSRSILSNRGSALIDPATNTLIITDNPSVLAKFETLIEQLDKMSEQVMIEARIVEAGDTVSRDLGVQFGFSRAGRTAWGNSWGNALNNRNVASGNATEQLLTPNVNLPVSTAGAISLVRSISSGALGLELSAMETDNRVKTISTPRILTQDRKQAEIRQGVQIPYQTVSDGTVTTAFKDAVLSLKVTPNITPERQILLDIVINKDDPDYANANASGEPPISTKQVTTQAMVEDGGTLVVGGIYQETSSNRVSKVPLLGDLPVLGNLFKSRERSSNRNEVLFFITPRIMGAENNVMRY